MSKFPEVNVDAEIEESKRKILSFINELRRGANGKGLFFEIMKSNNFVKVVAGNYGAFISSQVRKLDAKIKIEALNRLKEQGVDITMHSARDYLVQAGVSSISYTTANKYFATPQRKSLEHKAVMIDASKYPGITQMMLDKLGQAKDAWAPVKKECRDVFNEALTEIVHVSHAKGKISD